MFWKDPLSILLSLSICRQGGSMSAMCLPLCISSGRREVALAFRELPSSWEANSAADQLHLKCGDESRPASIYTNKGKEAEALEQSGPGSRGWPLPQLQAGRGLSSSRLSHSGKQHQCLPALPKVSYPKLPPCSFPTPFSLPLPTPPLPRSPEECRI